MNTNPQTKPSAGAVRAAEAYMTWKGENRPQYIEDATLRLAAIIDRESGLAELLTLRDRAKAFLACADPNGPWSQDEREGLAYLRQAVHAIEKDTV